MTDLEKRVSSLEGAIQKILDYVTPESEVTPEEVIGNTEIANSTDLTRIRGVAKTRADKLVEYGALTIGAVSKLVLDKKTARAINIPYPQLTGIVQAARALIESPEGEFGKEPWTPASEGTLDDKVLRMDVSQLANTVKQLFDQGKGGRARELCEVMLSQGTKTTTKAPTSTKKKAVSVKREAKLQKEFEGVKIVDFNTYVLACASLGKVFFPSLKRNEWIHKSEQTRAYLDIFKPYNSGAIDLEFVHELADTIAKKEA